MGSKSAIAAWLLCAVALVLFHCSSAAANTFEQPPINTSFSIVENQTAHETVGQLMQSGGEQFRFSEVSEFCSKFFTINENTSLIRTVDLLDREAVIKSEAESDLVQCFVLYSNKSTGIVETIRITIRVLDINDEAPRFYNLEQPHTVIVVENVAPPTPLLRLEPVDNDNGLNGTVHFNITSGNTDYFTIMKAEGDTSDTATRILFLRRELDFEVHDTMFNLTVRIWDMGSPSNFSFDQEIMVEVRNSFDEPPTFPTSRFLFDIPEDHPVGITHPFANITAANTQEVLGSIFYYLCEDAGCERTGPSGIILVNQVTGGLYLNSSLDYENEGMRRLEFYVTARNPANGGSMNAFVRVTVRDVNDNAPYLTDFFSGAHFTQTDYNVIENKRSVNILWLQANDDDTQVSGYVFNVTSKPPIEDKYVPSIDSDGLLVFQLNATFDREETPNITISITVSNTDAPHLNSTAFVNIYVGDVNDNAPFFTHDLFTTYASEGSPIAKEVLTLAASDRDAGNNSRLTYNITSVDKPTAKKWFNVSSSTGAITVVSNDIDYSAVGGEVVLNVTAHDNGEEQLSTSTIVAVKIVPAITFSARSHQAFANYNLAGRESYPVYLEFQTSADNGILLYQQNLEGDRFQLALEGRTVVLRVGAELPVVNRSSVLDNSVAWYSVEVDRKGERYELDIWETGSRQASPILSQGKIQNCTHETDSESTEELLYIGGLNPLLMTGEDASRFTSATDFVGAIRNVVIGPSQVNMRCPIEEQNTLIGVQKSSQCSDEVLQCAPAHSTGCVDYAEESFCRCRGGFASSICNGNSGQDSYAPIRLRGNGPVTMELPYSFVYDLEMLGGSGNGGNVNEPFVPGGKRRKRRQVSDGESQLQRTLQTVEVSFRPVEVGTTNLLHTESKYFIHQLRILESGSLTYRIYDNISPLTTPKEQVLISGYELKNGTEYHVSITFNNSGIGMTITDGVRNKLATDMWSSAAITLFVEQPGTTFSIGGTPEDSSFFVGCVSRLAVDQIEIPLSGLASLSEGEGGFSVNSSDSVEQFCDLCDLTTCQGNLVCLSDLVGGTDCGCLEGYVLDEATGICQVIPPSTDGLTPNALTNPSIYIAGGTAGGVLLVAVMIVAIIITIRVQHVKYGKKKRTYSVTVSDGILPSQRTSKTGNDYVRVEPKRSSSNVGDSLTCIGTTCTRADSRDRGSSVSTFQEHAEDGDPEIDEPPRLQRRKSTVSAESGIRTDTERESSLRGASRMDDSGTDYTPQESESDEFASSCFMEPVNSPVNVHLVGSAHSLMGLPMNATSSNGPLSPQERKTCTPLRPDSIRLSMSDDEHHHTDFDTDISSCHHQSVHKLRRGSDSDNSTKISDRSASKWYKSSTASDNERESERALKNRAYYPPPVHTESYHYSHPPRPKTAFGGPAPDHVPPPSISTRKSASPVFPRSPSRRMPPTMISAADSPLTRNTHKYENYPFPYSTHHLPTHTHPLPPPVDPVRERGTRGAVHGYVNHHIQHQISAPGPQDHHHIGIGGGGDGRHVSFAKSSQTLHYSRSVGRDDYTPPQQQQSRQYYTLASAIPTSLQYRQNRSFSSSDVPPPDREQMQFQDLKNVSTINPIAYWEMQDRLKPTVDQVDPYQVLSEPYIQFEDVSTDLSVTQSEATLHANNGPDHEVFESQGGGEGTADMGPGCLSRLQDHDTSSITTDSQSIPGGITHFPSADCSHEYTATINGTSSSGDSTPKYQPSNGFVIPSQQSFDV